MTEEEHDRFIFDCVVFLENVVLNMEQKCAGGEER